MSVSIGHTIYVKGSAQAIDRYGVWWYLTAPQHKPNDGFDPDGFEYNRT